MAWFSRQKLVRVDKSGCGKKVRYANEEAARAAGMESLQRNDNGYNKLYTYRCTDCKGWHLSKKRNRNAPITADNPVAI